jgi:hypothetical protein
MDYLNQEVWEETDRHKWHVLTETHLVVDLEDLDVTTAFLFNSRSDHNVAAM